MKRIEPNNMPPGSVVWTDRSGRCLLSYSKLFGGRYEVQVHIADEATLGELWDAITDAKTNPPMR